MNVDDDTKGRIIPAFNHPHLCNANWCSQANLGPAEQDFFAEYAELVGSYAEALNLDLATVWRF
jgi:hypothetical protein